MKNVWTICGAMFCSIVAAHAQSGLQVTYGSKGIATLSYNGTVLEDTGAYPADQFHIWHMKSSDFAGNSIVSGQYGWGERNIGTSWDAASRTETYQFSWGAIATQFVQAGDTLNLVVTERNNAGSGIVFDGAEIYALALHFPQMPAGFSGYSQYAITTTGPAVSAADYGSGVVTSVVPDESPSLYGGWKNAGGNTYTPLMSSTAPDGLPNFLPSNDQPLQPGQSLTYTVSLRFTPEGTVANAADAYASFAAKYPNQMNWTDRRILGTAYLASSPMNGNITLSGGYPTNPRRYFNDPAVDITTDGGVRSFQARMLAQAATNVATARGLNSQGVITWDIEGEQYPQSTSYVCSPDQIAAVAPEMEAPVLDAGSVYAGLPLDTAYFRTMTDAGLRVGVCLRPQVFTVNANGTANQSFLTGNATIIANLETKARFAIARWGATLFYVDSTVDATGGTLDPAIFQQLSTDLPQVLFIPEESTPRYYAYSAPFYSFLFHTDLGTPLSVLNVYPKAFGANLVNDVSAATLAAYTPQLTAQVRQGDILMGHADYWQANDPTLVSIYAAAGLGTGSPAPVQGTPVISWPTPGAIVYGTALSGAQLNASSNVAGTFAYTPAAGSVPGAGSQTLSVTFTPADPTNHKPASATTTLQVSKATPVLSWPSPAAITAGTALSAAQLNATGSVPGTFTYSPAAGVVPGVGTAVLTALFTPADTVDYTTAAASANLQVTAVQQQTPQLSWAAPAPIVYGTALSAAQLNATSNVPGSFTYTPAPGTVLSAGSYSLRALFTPDDTTQYTTATAGVPLIVTAAPPADVKIAILSPAAETAVSGQIVVTGLVKLPLDSAGTYLMVDGQEVGTHRVLEAPWLYPLDTTTLANGPHALQLWGHDIGNNTTLSATVTVIVYN